MIIVSVDPGYDRCGVAVIKKENGKDTLISSQCITTNKKASFEHRLLFVVSEFCKITKKHKPDICAFENLFFTTNQKTAMRVAETRGALIFTTVKQDIPVYEFTPKQVKIAITGDGGASKQQVMMILPKLINIEKAIKYDDEYDAIAVGITASASILNIMNEKNYPQK
jgi:crossover junction endodeoxyribonuclease RuvC